MWYQRESGAIHGADGVIHHPQKERLNVGQISGDVKREILAVSTGQNVIPREHPIHHEHGDLGPFALMNHVLTRGDRFQPEGQLPDPADVGSCKSAMLAGCRDQKLHNVRSGEFRIGHEFTTSKPANGSPVIIN